MKQLQMPLFIFLSLVGIFSEAGSAESTPAPSEWRGDTRVLRYKERDYIIGVRNASTDEFPLVGARKLHESSYADQVYPMTIQEQDTFVIYDPKRKVSLILNVATCLKGKDTATSEKTDWIGEVTPSGEHWEGDILFIRKYDPKGEAMRAPYFSMGRAYPISVGKDGQVTVQYDYFGNLKLDLVGLEVSDETARRIIDEHAKHYRKKED